MPNDLPKNHLSDPRAGEYVARVLNTLEDDELIENIRRSWTFYLLLKDPSEKVKRFFIRYIPTALYFIEDPSYDLCIESLEAHWTKEIYAYIKDNFDTGKEFENHVNKLKLQYGPLIDTYNPHF